MIEIYVNDYVTNDNGLSLSLSVPNYITIRELKERILELLPLSEMTTEENGSKASKIKENEVRLVKYDNNLIHVHIDI